MKIWSANSFSLIIGRPLVVELLVFTRGKSIKGLEVSVEGRIVCKAARTVNVLKWFSCPNLLTGKNQPFLNYEIPDGHARGLFEQPSKVIFAQVHLSCQCIQCYRFVDMLVYVLGHCAYHWVVVSVLRGEGKLFSLAELVQMDKE